MNALPPRDIDVFNCPLDASNLIEASAGTGKTWSLCGLYLRCVLETGQPVERILVVTYTKAATAELRERICARLGETLAALDGQPPGADPFVGQLLAALRGRGLDTRTMRERLEQALAGFDQAAIFTIHGFCQRALGDAPIAGNAPLQLQLVPDDSELMQRAVADAWRRHIGQAALSPAFAACLVERPLTPATVVPLLQRRLARPLAAERWPEAQEAAADAGHEDFAAAFAALQTQWPGWRDELQARLLAAVTAKDLSGTRYKPATIATALAEWDAWLALPAAAAPPAASKLELLGTPMLAASRNKNGSLPQHPGFDAATTLLAARAAVDAGLDQAWRLLLRRLLDDAQARLLEAKRHQRVAGYDDLLGNLHRALHADPERGERLAAELRQRFPVALIDEFQDTDPLQWAIFARVWVAGPEAGTLFLVGDPKQAIYRFRHADVHTYLGARARCRRQYTLAQNQRSRGTLIAAVNRLFGANAAAFMRDGLVFHAAGEGAKPRPAWQAPAGLDDALRIWLLPGSGDERLDYQLAKRAALAACANEIAQLIVAGGDGSVRVGSRGLLPRDIAVLVRSHAQAGAMRAALAALGVDSVELAQESVFHSREAAEVGVLLAAISEPQDERRLRAALATELVGLNAGEIAALEADGPATADPDALARHVERFAGYRELWRSHGFAPLWRALFAGERLVPRLLRRPDGERRLTNLMHLGELMQAEARGLGAGDAFLRWYAAQRDAADAEAAALRLESDRDLVQIVTVHKSKGLEYPVVFCPLLWAASGNGGEPPIAGAEYREEDASVVDFRADPEVAAMAAAAAQREDTEEELRLIYVALTRAVQRCYLVAGISSRKTRGKPSTKAARRRTLNWLVAGDGVTAAEWLAWDKGLDARLGADAIDAAWQALDDGAAIRVEPLPQQAPQPLDAAPPDAARLEVRGWSRQVGESWRIGSFSGLMRHGAEAGAAAAAEAAADRDELLALAAPGAAPTDDADAADTAAAPLRGADDILGFPRGATAGECLHAMFEHADFTRPPTWPAAIAAALRRFPVAGPEQDSRFAAMAAAMLRDVTTTEIAPGVRLGEVANSRRLNELAFHFPADLSSGEIGPLLTELGYPMPPLDGGGRLRGFLGGFIDLVCEADGRFWVLDWKSNHLGETPADYGRRGVGTAMAAHGYHLQSLIYSVAVHRYLTLRLPGYDYQRDFGGILYLFVRGVRPGWRDAAGQPCGVWLHKPTVAALRAVEALLTRS